MARSCPSGRGGWKSQAPQRAFEIFNPQPIAGGSFPDRHFLPCGRQVSPSSMDSSTRFIIGVKIPSSPVKGFPRFELVSYLLLKTLIMVLFSFS